MTNSKKTEKIPVSMMVTRKGVYHHDTNLVLLTAVGGGLRLALNVAVQRKLGLSLGLPPILALAVLLLAVLPDIITPIDINLPLGLLVGLLLPDLLVRRGW